MKYERNKYNCILQYLSDLLGISTLVSVDSGIGLVTDGKLKCYVLFLLNPDVFT